MSMHIADGREYFYQWDIDREMIVDDPSITELHFCNGRSECSLVCEVKNGRACVPNILLQTAGNIRVYGYVDDHTGTVKVYRVMPRTKPEDYVYTETEVKRYDALEERLTALEKTQGGSNVTPEQIQRVVEEYMVENPAVDEAARQGVAENAKGIEQLSEEKLDKSRFEAIVEGDVPSVNLYAPQTNGWIDNAYIVSSGYPTVNEKTYAKYCVTPDIPVEGGKTYTVSHALTAASTPAKNRIGVYDASGTTLGAMTITDNADGSMTFTVPAAAKNIKFSVWKEVFDIAMKIDTVIGRLNATVMLVEGTAVPDEYVPYVPEGNRLKNIALPAKSVALDTIGNDAEPVIAPLMGKKIANFGDSIFGNARPPLDVSTFLGNNTGATVYNCAFGGCRMAAHTGHWDAFSMYRLADAIANNDYALQNEAINYDDRTSYAEEPLALMKTIDYSALDILTIGYGTNDFTGNVTIDSAAKALDNSTVCGALRYSIETLLTAYPNLRIFVLLPAYRFWIDSDNAYVDDALTHTNDLGKTLAEYNEAIAATAKAYNIPVIDNFAELGINKYNRYQYFHETDGTHHNENGRKLLAQHLADKLW